MLDKTEATIGACWDNDYYLAIQIMMTNTSRTNNKYFNVN